LNIRVLTPLYWLRLYLIANSRFHAIISRRLQHNWACDGLYVYRITCMSRKYICVNHVLWYEL